jgi:hypothetical protein
MKLTHYRSSYAWKFVPAGDKTYTDSGNTPCHNQGGSQKD